MIQFQYQDLKKRDLMVAFNKLCQFPRLKPQKALMVAKVSRQISEKEISVTGEFLEIVKQYCVLDDKGEIVPQEGQPGTYQIKEENQKAFQKVMDEFNVKTFEVKDCSKLYMKEIEGANLTPNEILAIEPMLTNVELLEPEKSLVL